MAHPKVPPPNSLEIAKKTVDDLYEYRDHYFERNSLEKVTQKTEDVYNELQKTLEVLDNLKDTIKEKAEFLMLNGKALNVLAPYDQNAHDMLSKAVKLKPQLAEAWVQLGECYWKKRDYEASKNCFLGALNHSEDKVALRNLSVVLRWLGADDVQSVTLANESVERAKAAVKLDITDGMSWYALGRAYLSLFFIANQNAKTLQQSMSAFKQAEKDPVTAGDHDFHFNRAMELRHTAQHQTDALFRQIQATVSFIMAYRYQEQYELAIRSFAKASALDPTGTEAHDQELALIKYLTDMSQLVLTKGKLKAKKLQNLLDSIKESDLGPYGGGSYTSPHGHKTPLTCVPLGSLRVGPNTERVVLGKVVCSLTTIGNIPFSVCIVDREGTCVSVTVYNLAVKYGMKIGDSLAIADPYLEDVNISYKEKGISYRSIRVSSPLVLVVNGKKIGLNKQAPAVLASFTQDD